MFQSIAETAACQSRVVDCAANGDARQRSLFLFLRELRDEVVVEYVLRSQDAGVGTAPAATPGGREACIQEVLDRVVSYKEDEVQRMAVARAAGRIVRTDVAQQEDLKNVPPPGARHNYAEELGMEVQDPRKSLAGRPRP